MLKSKLKINCAIKRAKKNYVGDEKKLEDTFLLNAIINPIASASSIHIC